MKSIIMCGDYFLLNTLRYRVPFYSNLEIELEDSVVQTLDIMEVEIYNEVKNDK